MSALSSLDDLGTPDSRCLPSSLAWKTSLGWRAMVAIACPVSNIASVPAQEHRGREAAATREERG